MKKIKYSFRLIFILLLVQNSYYKLLANTDSTRFDVLHYEISIDFSDLSSHSITASTSVLIRSTEDNLSKMMLFLQALTVDSVKVKGIASDFEHTSPYLTINLPNPIKIYDSQTVTIYYHGSPVHESWGGFYFNDADGGCAFNMGVAFSEYPHSYGRVWFPCNESFSDKATISYHITTDSLYKAVCGGILVSTNVNSNKTITYNWEMKQPIPVYLASVAVAKFTDVSFNFYGKEKTFPVNIFCLPQDTNRVKQSFINLKKCLEIFEDKFGPYPFDRVGFVLVPFNSGAMEHAANIAIPRSLIDGTLNNESLWVHELSHSWWGDLVTCETDKDMWLNEGTASYSEFLFNEFAYGKTSYLNSVQANHKHVLQYAHIMDSEVLPLSPMPVEVTYGRTTYDKGADIMHSLRSYLGDTVFFNWLKYYFNTFKFSTISAIQFKDSLTKFSGIDMSWFFENWIFEKGFPSFSVDSFYFIKENNLYKTTVLVSNTPRFTGKDYLNVPLNLRVVFSDKTEINLPVSMSWKTKTFNFEFSKQPVLVFINADNKINDAVTRNIRYFISTGIYDLNYGLMKLNIKSLSDSVLIEIAHHWTDVDHEITDLKGIRFSDYRYWKVTSNYSKDFICDATIKYNGRTTSYDGTTFLDHTLNIINEDSLVLLYRPSYQAKWIIYPSYTLNTGLKTNAIGEILISNLKPGYYCIGIRDYKASTGFIDRKNLKFFPNPASEKVFIDMSSFPFDSSMIYIYDTNGRLKLTQSSKTKGINEVNVGKFPDGLYFLCVKSDENTMINKLIITHQ